MKENFNSEEYRKGLAEDLKELPKEDRSFWLDSEKNTDKYQQAEKFNEEGRDTRLQEARTNRVAELDEKIAAARAELGLMTEKRDTIATLNNQDTLNDTEYFLDNPEYITNFENIELWNEISLESEAIIQERLDTIKRLATPDVHISYDAGQVGSEMFEVAREIFNIPENVSFKDLPDEVREKFIKMRIRLEEKNGLHKKIFTPTSNRFV